MRLNFCNRKPPSTYVTSENLVIMNLKVHYRRNAELIEGLGAIDFWHYLI